jgi:hypothetical protein
MHDGRDRKDREQPRERGTRAILDALAEGDPKETITLEALVADWAVAPSACCCSPCVLPAFIPIPIGGAISGPLTMLIGRAAPADDARTLAARFPREARARTAKRSSASTSALRRCCAGSNGWSARA